MERETEFHGTVEFLNHKGNLEILENLGCGRLKLSSKTIQLIRGRAQMRTQVSWPSSPTSFQDHFSDSSIGSLIKLCASHCLWFETWAPWYPGLSGVRVACFQYCGHLMGRTDSLKRPWCWERLKEGGKGDDRGWQRMRWLYGITDTMDTSLSKFQEIVKEREVWCAVVHRVSKSQTWLSDWTRGQGPEMSAQLCSEVE